MYDSFSLDGGRERNRAEGPDRPAQPALPRHTGTARRWSMTPLGGDTVTIVVIAILLLLAVLIVAGPVLENIIDRIWPPAHRR